MVSVEDRGRMYGDSRLGNGRVNGNLGTPLPLTSRHQSPRSRLGWIKGRGQFFRLPLEVRTLMQKLVYVDMSMVFRRRGVLLFAPLIYFSGMLLFMRALPFDMPSIVERSPPGSMYRNPQGFDNLWSFMQADYNYSNAV